MLRRAVRCGSMMMLLQVLPTNGKRYHEIRQGKVAILPTCTIPFQNLIKVCEGLVFVCFCLQQGCLQKREGAQSSQGMSPRA